MRKGIVICLGIVLVLTGAVLIWHGRSDKAGQDAVSVEDSVKEIQEKPTEEKPVTTEKEEPETLSEAEEVRISDVQAQRMDAGHIKIRWEGNLDDLVSGYSVEKRDNRTAENTTDWTPVAKVRVGEDEKAQVYECVDTLASTDPQQYVYRVVPQFHDPDAYIAAEGNTALCSNWKICIDPGHYAGKNEVPGADSYGYAEGNFTLQIALQLQERLENDYGIAVSMTRNSGSISMGGYTDASLDSGHISLRGAYAAEQGCNLFVSIHTNANEDNANGAGTFRQPIALDKPLIIANDLVLASETLCEVSNAIGKNLAQVSYQLGISSHENFTPVSAGKAIEWTTAFNDSTKEQGTVVCRHGTHGQYYGVLRGAQEAGIPGMIIEHGYHTVPQMREVAMQGDLKNTWANADAEGIAQGFGFQKLK